jgi:hypothetical protein
MITVNCSCGKTYQVNDSYANKKAKCTCGKVLSVPEISDKELNRPSDKINFSCSNCGKTFNVSPKFKGKKVRCKSCQTIQTVPVKTEQSDNRVINEEDTFHEVDASQQDTDISSDKQVSDLENEDVAQESDSNTESQDSEQIKSSEKPKRVLLICLVMVLLGAIAYGFFIFHSGKNDEAVPTKQTTSVESHAEKRPESSETKSNLTEQSESDTLNVTSTEGTGLEEAQSETTNVEPQKEPINPPETDKLIPQPQKKTEEAIQKQSETPQQLNTEKKKDKKTTPVKPVVINQSETQINQNTQKMIAAVDPKTLKEDTKKYLRKNPMTYTKKQVVDMIQKYNFYEAHFNPNGGFPNRFVDNRNGTITDNETLLMWQKSGTREMVSWKKAPEYIDRLNNRKFSGYSDWRLPTLEELLTLTEPRHSRQGLYISSFFSQKQGIVASSDSCTYDGMNLPWYISFLRGISNCISYNLIDEFHVRAVRSMERPD